MTTYEQVHQKYLSLDAQKAALESRITQLENLLAKNNAELDIVKGEMDDLKKLLETNRSTSPASLPAPVDGGSLEAANVRK